jgi:hypothetical protein
VYGAASDDPCDDVVCVLDILDNSGATTWTSTQNVEWLDPSHWQATFPLTTQHRARLCQARTQTDPPRPAYQLSAKCPACLKPAYYAEVIECCPTVSDLAAIPGECVDPDHSGLLLRPLTVTWKVVRNSAAGSVQTQASVNQDTRIQSGQVHTLNANIIGSVFEEVFYVPPGVNLKVGVEILGFDDCVGLSLLLDPLLTCSCEYQPVFTQNFVVQDENGQVLTQQVLDGKCVSAKKVVVQAPADARNSRFEWVAPAQADPNNPYQTTVDVPDTDAGIEVNARIGSDPCIHERRITIVRCQARPGFCGWLPLTCPQVEAMWMVLFYFASMLVYVGVSLMSAFAIDVVAERAGAATAAIAMALGLGFTLGGLLLYLAWLFLVLYWLMCCAPRSPCRYLRSFSWLLMWIGLTIPLWALMVMVLGLLLQLKIFTLGGIGVGTLFSYLITSLLTGGVWLAMKWFHCPLINPFDLPPVLES